MKLLFDQLLYFCNLIHNTQKNMIAQYYVMQFLGETQS